MTGCTIEDNVGLVPYISGYPITGTRKPWIRLRSSLPTRSNLADAIAQTHPTHEGRIVSIPNGYSREFWDKAKPVHPRECDPGDFIILYSGNDYLVRGSDFPGRKQTDSPGSVSGVLKTLGRHLAARQLRDNGPNFSVVMLGPEKNKGKRTAFDPVRLGTVNFLEVPGYLLAADLLVLCMPRQEAGSAPDSLEIIWVRAVRQAGPLPGPEERNL